MAKSDSRFEYKANLGRTDFDLSQRLGLTTAPGMLNPVWFDYASPGDSYYMQHDLPLLRSGVLAQPSMVDVKVHYETFFVPMQMIYEPFEQTMFSLKNFRSNFYDIYNANLKNNALPVFDYNDFVTQVINVQNPTNDYHTDAFRLADLMGLNPVNFTGANALKQVQYVPNFFPYQLLAYHTIYQYYYRLDDKSQFENSYINWDKYYDSTTAVKMVRDFMQIHQRPWDFDYFTSLYRSPIASDDNLQRLMGYSNYSDLSDAITTENKIDGGFVSVNKEIANFANDPSGSPDQGTLMKAINTASILQMFSN